MEGAGCRPALRITVPDDYEGACQGELEGGGRCGTYLLLTVALSKRRTVAEDSVVRVGFNVNSNSTKAFVRQRLIYCRGVSH